MNRYASIILSVSVCSLLCLGLVMLFSAQQLPKNDADVGKQLMWLGVGSVGCWVLAIVDYRTWQAWTWPVFCVALFLLGLCFAPGIGVTINGATRWVRLKVIGVNLQVQPSELAKLAGIIVMAGWYSRYREQAGTALYGFLFPGMIAFMLVALIAIEVDIGSATLLSVAVAIIMLMAGVKFRWLMLGVIGAIGAIVGAVYTIPERMNRFLAFLDLEKHAQTDGWQQIKSLQALGVGGWNGVGLGKAISEVGRLPFLENDFIFPMIGGDLGLQFSLLVVFAFVLIMVAGVTIALHAPDRFGMLLGVGIVGLIVFQAIIHIAVTTGSMPNTGLPLPFVSQGGSNLVVCLAGIGLLLSIHRRAWMEPEFVQPQLRMNLRITPRV